MRKNVHTHVEKFKKLSNYKIFYNIKLVHKNLFTRDNVIHNDDKCE